MSARASVPRGKSGVDEERTRPRVPLHVWLWWKWTLLPCPLTLIGSSGSTAEVLVEDNVCMIVGYA